MNKPDLRQLHKNARKRIKKQFGASSFYDLTVDQLQSYRPRNEMEQTVINWALPPSDVPIPVESPQVSELIIQDELVLRVPITRVKRTRVKRQKKSKSLFRCGCCQQENRSSQLRPTGWKRFWFEGVEHLVCSEGCKTDLRDRLQAANFLPMSEFTSEWLFPSGKHAGSKLCAVPEDYFFWLRDNLANDHVFFRAATMELLRRYPKSIKLNADEKRMP